MFACLPAAWPFSVHTAERDASLHTTALVRTGGGDEGRVHFRSGMHVLPSYQVGPLLAPTNLNALVRCAIRVGVSQSDESAPSLKKEIHGKFQEYPGPGSGPGRQVLIFLESSLRVKKCRLLKNCVGEKRARKYWHVRTT